MRDSAKRLAEPHTSIELLRQLYRHAKNIPPLQRAPLIRPRLRLVVVRERACHLPCAHLWGYRRHSRREPCHCDRLNRRRALARGFLRVRRDLGVVVVDGDEEGPDAVVHDLPVPPDVVGGAHSRAERDVAHAEFVVLARGARERDEGAGARGGVAAPALVEDGLGGVGQGVVVALRGDVVGEDLVETMGCGIDG